MVASKLNSKLDNGAGVAGEESILGVYGRQSSFADMEFDDAVAAIEANDFRDLRCNNIILFGMSAEVLGAKLEQLCLEDDDLLEDLRLEQRAGAILLRVAPVDGDHVRLVDLADLIAVADAARDAAVQSRQDLQKFNVSHKAR